MKHISFLSVGFVLVCCMLGTYAANAADLPSTPDPLELAILSSDTLNGIAGDYVTVDAQIKNLSGSALQGITTYLSLVDTENKLPVDLEDWSAEKGRFVGTIESGQVLPLSWKIHFVKAGSYNLAIVANAEGRKQPQISSVTHFNVQLKRNLNPGHVLPVALITPLVVIFVIFLLSFWRGRKIM